MNELKKLLGENMELARKSNVPKLSREKVAEKMGVDASTIYRWEKGESWPEAEMIERFAEAVKVPAPSLFVDKRKSGLSAEAILDFAALVSKADPARLQDAIELLQIGQPKSAAPAKKPAKPSGLQS